MPQPTEITQFIFGQPLRRRGSERTVCYLPLRLGNIQKQHDFLSNSCGGYVDDFRRTFLRCHDGRDIGEITFGRATSADELSLPLGSTVKSRSTRMSTKYQSCGSLFTCPSAGQLNSRFSYSVRSPARMTHRTFRGLKLRAPDRCPRGRPCL